MSNLQDDKAAYKRAQSQRNAFIGLGLVAFVALVFFTTMSRMSSNMKKEHAIPVAIKAS